MGNEVGTSFETEMDIYTLKRNIGMENEITHQKRCGIGKWGKEGLYEYNGIILERIIPYKLILKSLDFFILN